jgi:histone deacetylase 11
VKIIYSPAYNIDFGLFNRLHPFDGSKYGKVAAGLRALPGIDIAAPKAPVEEAMIHLFVGQIFGKLLSSKRYILQGLELPWIPLLPFSMIDRRILAPMRWAVAGTLMAARGALREGSHIWNLSGGYHHASRNAAEGFCVYNDIGIAVEQLRREQVLRMGDRILIVDIDAHHGNGNAHVFMEDRQVDILDIYNDTIYPRDGFTRQRIDINIPLGRAVSGDEYLARLRSGLDEVSGGHVLAFVVAGTDVLASDPLGGMRLSVADCVERDAMVLTRLSSLGTPTVFVGGGGYGKESAAAMSASIANLLQR